MQLYGFAGRWTGMDDFSALERLVETQAAEGRPVRLNERQPNEATPNEARATSSAAPGAARGTGSCAAPYVAAEGGITVALKGAPIWFPARAEASLVANPAAAILAAYRQHGASLLDTLHGAFALAIVDSRSDTVLLAVDRMGIEAMAYATSGTGIVFGSSAGRVAHFPGRQVSLRPQALFDFFMMHMVASPDTVYEGVRKIEPGSCITFAAGRLTGRRYWQPVFRETANGNGADLEAELHSSLRTAVLECRPDATTSGAFLSGGLDSSTVAGVLASVSDKPARTFSIGFGVESYNELDFARIAAKRFKFDSVEYHVTSDDIVTAFPLIASAYEEPFGNSSAVPTYFCAKVARDHGVNHLLAGDGGDEIFGGNERYGKQRVFEAYFKLPGALRKGLIEPLATLIPQEFGFTPARKFRSYIDQAKITLPERFEYWNLMYRADLSAMLDPRFQAAIDPKGCLKLMTQVYDTAGPNASLLNRMLAYDWHFTLADNDLRKVGTMCSLAGVKVSYPMLDPRVIDLSIRVPSALKMNGSELRTFYKHAMRDFLPHEILNKTKHGFGLPFGVWLKTDARLADLIFSALTDLKARRIVRAEFLDQLIREQRAGDASYFGYAIWDLAMLEAWLKAHAPTFSAS